MTVIPTLTSHSQRLLDALFANPWDELTRIMLADSLQDRDGIKPEDAFPDLSLPPGVEIVRQNGVPTEIKCLMRQWVGYDNRRCGKCGNSVERYPGWLTDTFECFGCGCLCKQYFESLAPAIAAMVCKFLPISSVVLIDVKPAYMERIGGFFCYWMSSEGDYERSYCLEDNLFEIISTQYSQFITRQIINNRRMDFLTESDAIQAVNHCALILGRQQAGRPLV